MEIAARMAQLNEALEFFYSEEGLLLLHGVHVAAQALLGSLEDPLQLGQGYRLVSMLIELFAQLHLLHQAYGLIRFCLLWGGRALIILMAPDRFRHYFNLTRGVIDFDHGLLFCLFRSSVKFLRALVSSPCDKVFGFLRAIKLCRFPVSISFPALFMVSIAGLTQEEVIHRGLKVRMVLEIRLIAVQGVYLVIHRPLLLAVDAWLVLPVVEMVLAKVVPRL